MRVMAPAQRDELSAVMARFRSRRDSARSFAVSLPSAERFARSTPASEPRWDPTARRTATSLSSVRSRVRTRTPLGGATTNGSVTWRRRRLTLR